MNGMDRETAAELAKLSDKELRVVAQFHRNQIITNVGRGDLHAEALTNIKAELARRAARIKVDSPSDVNVRGTVESMIALYGFGGITRILANLAREQAAQMDRAGLKESARMFKVGSGYLDEAAPFFTGKPTAPVSEIK